MTAGRGRVKSAPETWKCRRRSNVFGQSIPDPRFRNVEGPTVDSRNVGTTRRLELAERSARRIVVILFATCLDVPLRLCVCDTVCGRGVHWPPTRWHVVFIYIVGCLFVCRARRRHNVRVRVNRLHQSPCDMQMLLTGCLVTD